jgi:hypothetical protein
VEVKEEFGEIEIEYKFSNGTEKEFDFSWTDTAFGFSYPNLHKLYRFVWLTVFY